MNPSRDVPALLPDGRLRTLPARRAPFCARPRPVRIVTAAGSLAGAAASVWLACLILFGAGTLTIELPGVLAAGGRPAVPAGPPRRLLPRGHRRRGDCRPRSTASGYTAAYDGRYSVRWIALQSNAFLLSMSLVTCAASVFTFLLAWEMMALSS